MFRIGDGGFGWSRREEAYGFALLLLFFLLVPGAFAQRLPVSDIVVKQTATQSLTLIKPSDPLFDGMIDQFYPGLSDAAGYQTSLHPFLVMVRNDTAVTAVAYAITWTLHYSDGSVKPISAMFVNRPFTSGKTFLAPLQMRLIAPALNLTLNQYPQQQRALAQYPAGAYPWSKELASVDIDMDGVIYSDGTFIGRDKTRVLQSYAMAQFGARDEVLATLNYIKSSTGTPVTVSGQLEDIYDKELQRGQLAFQKTLLAEYVKARGNTASDLRWILLHRGLVGLENLLQSFVSRSRGNTSPSMFAGKYQNLSDTDPRVFGSLVNPNGP